MDNDLLDGRREMNTSKIIFTDIDGVFHDGNDPLFLWAEQFWEVIAPYQVSLVIHSSWRLMKSFDEIREMFPCSLRERVVATTCGADPYESVLLFVEKNEVGDFIVIDDDIGRFPSKWIAEGRLILCETGTGLSNQGVLERIRKFLADDQSSNTETPDDCA